MGQHSSINHAGLTGVSPSYASNSTDVSSVASAGASNSVSRAEHVHKGIHSISHSSNTFYGDVTLVPQGTIGITSSAAGTFQINSTGGSGTGSSDLSGKEIKYVEFTAQVSPTATTEATANSVVDAGAVTFDGTAVVISFYCPAASPDNGAAGRTLVFWLYEDAASIGLLSNNWAQAANFGYRAVYVERRMTPSAGSHTYAVRASVSAGTGDIRGGPGGAGQYLPGFIRITKV